MKKIIVLSLALAAFLGAKEIKGGDFFLEDAKSAANLRAFLKANQDEIVKLNLSYCANKNSREGSGLGLALVRKIAALPHIQHLQIYHQSLKQEQ